MAQVISHSVLQLFHNEYFMLIITFLIVVAHIVACTSVQVMLKFLLAIPIVHYKFLLIDTNAQVTDDGVICC